MQRYRSIFHLMVRHHTREEAGDITIACMDAAVAGHDHAIAWEYARLASQPASKLFFPLPEDTYRSSIELWVQHDSIEEAAEVVVVVAKAALAADDRAVTGRHRTSPR